MKTYEIEILTYDRTDKVRVGKGRVIKGRDGRSLLEALIDSSLFIRSDCGGRGTCGKCRVNQISPSGEKTRITACNSEVTKNLTIEIPATSMLSAQIIDKAALSFPSTFADRITANDTVEGYGVAVDLGTTTIAAYLCEKSRGDVLSSIAVKNPQALYGDDVMSRIGAIGEEKSNLQYLQRLVVNAIEWAILKLLSRQPLNESNLSRIVVVGNPAMIHILSGVDPQPIGQSPYQPAFYEARTIDSNSIGFNLTNVPLRTLPQISGFIGGDILGAALAADMENQPEGTLLIDLGTNGELLFKAQEKLFATSCATGPAFEGASLSCGMQAIPGAINRVEIREASSYPLYTQINSDTAGDPVGICGTGAISAVAELWRHQIIDQGGGFIPDPAIIPLNKDPEGRYRYTLVKEKNAIDSSPVFISQKDIRSIQLGKAALITGIEFLTEAAGYSKPSKIIVAGAFGSYIAKEDMTTIGMIPDMDPEKIELAGNAAGTGAVMVLSDSCYYKKSITMANQITTIDLATDPKFQQRFVENLSFPKEEQISERMQN